RGRALVFGIGSARGDRIVVPNRDGQGSQRGQQVARGLGPDRQGEQVARPCSYHVQAVFRRVDRRQRTGGILGVDRRERVGQPCERRLGRPPHGPEGVSGIGAVPQLAADACQLPRLQT